MKKFVSSLAVLGSVLVATPAFAYEVKSGDTLSEIANQHQTEVQNIVELNPEIYDKHLIFIGQQLTMPGEGEQGQVKGEIQSNDSAPQESSNNQSSSESTESTSSTNESSSSEASQSSSSNESTESSSSEASQPSSSNESTESSSSEASQSSSSNESTESSSSEPTQSDSATTMNVEATAYTAFCEGCSGVTYTGIDLRANPNQKVIAVDPSVIPLGSTVYVEGYGEAIAGDIGGAITGNKIDLFMPEQQDALNFGRQNLTIHVYE
ncbi:3D domain-containing protein [Bacillus sp. Marseille-P3800]|uniref:3D domain-containing protein n=1 Tax=Bacillus sp. Marseille-P3800 TaxID=2014782 RepID=UPI000C071F05|nr:3D domain-containing protein [Bacillus sp. Marseille-P3800]